MPPISFKKILICILIVVLLSRLGRVGAFVYKVYGFFYDSFEPLRNSPSEARYVVMLLFLALIYISLFKLLQKRK